MSKICAFFGHRHLFNNENVAENLKKAIINLIEQEKVDSFFVGQQGYFELLAYKTVSGLKKIYPHISIYLIIAYANELHQNTLPLTDFYFPTQKVPRRAAICARNNWIIKHCDFLICWIKYPNGGAYQAILKAQHQNKKIINLADS